MIKELFGLSVLDKHSPLLITSAIACHCIYLLSDQISTRSVVSYAALNRLQKVNWGMHIVSMIHCLVIMVACIPVLLDEGLRNDPINGYSAYAGNVHAIACGYFLWDACVSLRYVRDFGVGFFIHGIACFSVYLMSFVRVLGMRFLFHSRDRFSCRMAPCFYSLSSVLRF